MDILFQPAAAEGFGGLRRHCVKFKRAKGGLRCVKFHPGRGQPRCPQQGLRLKGGGRLGRVGHCAPGSSRRKGGGSKRSRKTSRRSRRYTRAQLQLRRIDRKLRRAAKRACRNAKGKFIKCRHGRRGGKRSKR